ncbi:MAG: extracellular matrix regulator RemB [Oscillospiraceae bacterium]
MYLHLGQSVMVPYEEVIGVFDLDNASDSKWTRDFLRNAEEQSVVISVCDDIPRSFVVCDHPYHPQIVYLSQLSSQTLQKRVEQGPLSE